MKNCYLYTIEEELEKQLTELEKICQKIFKDNNKPSAYIQGRLKQIMSKIRTAKEMIDIKICRGQKNESLLYRCKYIRKYLINLIDEGDNMQRVIMEDNMGLMKLYNNRIIQLISR